MGLRIQNNIAAMNAHRQLTITDSALSKSLERLSSGYRINKAADDAAGLAISQSFRADIASFKVASRNTSEASALLQVAEGGMDQIGNMLTRLKELATQAASANVGAAERTKIDAEADALVEEIDRIANVTKYGSTSLLDGTFGSTDSASLTGGLGDGFVGTTNVAYDVTLSDGNNGTVVNAVGDSVAEGVDFYFALTAANGHTLWLANSDGVGEHAAFTAGATQVTFNNLGITMTFSAAITAAGVAQVTSTANTTVVNSATSTVQFTRTGLTSLTSTNAATGTYTISDAGNGSIKIYGPTMNETESFVSQGATISYGDLNISFKLDSDFDQTSGELDGMTFTVTNTGSGTGQVFQIGAKNDSNNQIEISIDGVTKTDLSIDGIDLSTSTGAQAALTVIDSAVSTLASSRGDIGAYMNRLGYAAANLATTIENMQAAESVIRDVDMADEMTTFTKSQILLQAGTAMLAQANMAPQMVLSLFG